MKRVWLAVAAAALALGTPGCIFVSDERSYETDPEDPTVVEIKAVSKLMFEQNKVRMLDAMAERPPRPTGAQAVLP